MLFCRENACEELFAEIGPLLERHYKEIAHYQDIELNPNYARYLELERGGALRIFTARMGGKDSSLIGYAVFFVTRNMHYQDSLQALQDIIYIEKSTRGVGIGKSFINWCDTQLGMEGVQVVHHHVKKQHEKPFGPLLESLGYNLVDLIYCRRLDSARSV
jgi:hypothetical protein